MTDQPNIPQCGVITGFPGNEFSMYLESDFVAKMLTDGTMWEQLMMRLWAAEVAKLSPTDMIIDAGAYTGVYSLLSVANGARNVHAFEPFPSIAVRLDANLRLNYYSDYVKIHRVALSDVTGKGELLVTGTSKLPSGSSLDPHDTKDEIGSHRVPLRTGDGLLSLLLQPSRLGLMKIDVENHELEVLKGFEQTLRTDRPVVFVELLTEDHYSMVRFYMESLGYTDVFLIAEDTQEVLTGNGLKSESFRTNYIFRCPGTP